jgi:sec-independent protein translocase protein TatB
MLPEIGATELMVIAAVALIVVGPKDLPVLMRKLGQFIARLRGMASEFRASFDDMARQSELDDLRREVEAMRNARFADIVPEAPTASGLEASDVMQEIHRSLNSPDSPVQLHPTTAIEPTIEVEAPKTIEGPKS